MKKYRNALVLGGGGAKGFAHIGAITVLERERLRPDIVCGTSAGSIAGALYGLYADKIDVFDKIEETREFKILEGLQMESVEFEKDQQGFFMKTLSTVKKKFLLVKMLRDNALVRREDVESVFKELFVDISFEDLPITLIAAAFDLVSGRDVYIRTGKLWKGIMASSAIPGIFPPVEYNGMLLIDGGITNRLPVKSAVLSGARNIIAIDLSYTTSLEKEMDSVVNLHLRTDELLTSRFDLGNSRMSDLVIKPDLGNMRWSDFQRYAYAMEKGREAARTSLPAIRRVMCRTHCYRKNIRRLLGYDPGASLIPSSEYLIL